MNTALANPYCQRTRLTHERFVQVIVGFTLSDSAVVTAHRTGVSVRSVNQIWNRIRRRIASHREGLKPLKARLLSPGERRVRGTRPQPGETYPRLVGVRRIGQQLICEWVPADQSLEAFRVLYRQKPFDPIQHDWGYEGLIDLDTQRLMRLPISNNGIEKDPTHPLSLEQFNQTLIAAGKRLCGWPVRNFYLHLKEAEWRHAYLGRDMRPDLLALLRHCPL